jgi:hypothetical protein
MFTRTPGLHRVAHPMQRCNAVWKTCNRNTGGLYDMQVRATAPGKIQVEIAKYDADEGCSVSSVRNQQCNSVTYID